MHRFGQHVVVWARLRTGTGTAKQATRTTSEFCRTLPRSGARVCQSAQSCRTWPPRRQKGVSKPLLHCPQRSPRPSSSLMFAVVPSFALLRSPTVLVTWLLQGQTRKCRQKSGSHGSSSSIQWSSGCALAPHIALGPPLFRPLWHYSSRLTWHQRCTHELIGSCRRLSFTTSQSCIESPAFSQL